MRKLIKPAFAVLLVSGCGGDDSSSGSGSSTNSSPVVDAGSAQTADENSTIQLAATVSDADGDALTYTWSQTSGTSGTFSSTSIEDPTFDVPAVDASETIILQLSVSDGINSTVSDTVTITVNDAGTTASADCETQTLAFEQFLGDGSVSCTDTYVSIYSETGQPAINPDDDRNKIMVGVESWINRVPIPYVYQWSIPTHPVATTDLVEAASRGPIGIAIDGVPIYHYEARPDASTRLADYDASSDTVLRGELDQCGGHAGQGEDYHYHYTPICLLEDHDLDLPIGYGLDGVPIYFGEGGDDYYGRGRFSDIDNLPDEDLDECNTITTADGEIVHYTTKLPPYTIGCHRAAIDSSLQIEPSVFPNRTQGDPVPAGEGLYGEAVATTITDFYLDDDGVYHLEHNPGTGLQAILFTPTSDTEDCWQFEYQTTAGEAGVVTTDCRAD